MCPVADRTAAFQFGMGPCSRPRFPCIPGLRVSASAPWQAGCSAAKYRKTPAHNREAVVRRWRKATVRQGAWSLGYQKRGEANVASGNAVVFHNRGDHDAVRAVFGACLPRSVCNVRPRRALSEFGHPSPAAAAAPQLPQTYIDTSDGPNPDRDYSVRFRGRRPPGGAEFGATRRHDRASGRGGVSGPVYAAEQARGRVDHGANECPGRQSPPSGDTGDPGTHRSHAEARVGLGIGYHDGARRAPLPVYRAGDQPGSWNLPLQHGPLARRTDPRRGCRTTSSSTGPISMATP